MSVMREGIKINDDGSISVTFASGSTIDSPTFTGTVTGSGTRLAEFGTAMISAPTGTMANNGAITLGTALNATYPKCYLYLPANAISSGSAAGWYYAEMASGTVGTVYNNTYTTGTPAPPASKTAFATTGPGAYTGDTSEQGVTVTVAANALAVNGRLSAWAWMANNNSAGTKTVRVRYSGSSGSVVGSQANTTSTGGMAGADIYASGTTSFQLVIQKSQPSGGSFAVVEGSGSVDTSVATSIFLSVQKDTATDYAILAPGEVLLYAP